MKKTQFKDALRTIRNRFVSYLSIVFIIMLGTGGFLMTRYAGNGLRTNATDFLIANGFKDYEIASSVGITDADIKRIQQVEGVRETEGAEVLTGSLSKGELSLDVTLLSWTEHISVPSIVEGTRPETDGECAVSADIAATYGIRIGDTVLLSTEDIYNVNPLRVERVTVTALVAHPDYIRSSVTNCVVLPLSSFNLEGMENRYTRLFLTAEGASQKHMFESLYEASTKPTTAALKGLIPALEADSLAEAQRLANETIDREWAKAEEQIADAEKQIDDGEAQLNAKLAEADAQLAWGRAQLASAYRQLMSGEAQLHDAEAMLAAINQVRSLLRGKNPLELVDFLNTVNGYIDAYNAAEDEWTRNEIRNALKAWLAQDGVRENAEIIKAISGIDLNAAADNPPSLIPAQNAMRDVTAILLLAAAANDGINPVDIYTDVETLSRLLDEIDAAPSEEAANAARWKLADYLSNPDVQRRLGYVSLYLGMDVNELIWLTTADALDEYQRGRLQQLVLQMRRIKNSIANAEAMIAAGRAKLNAGWAQYYEGLRLLREKEAEKNALEAEYRKKIADARKELADKIEEGKAQLAEARARAAGITANWIIQERIVNTGYVDVLNNSSTAYKMGYAVGGLFLIVAALVCFSTLIIIIEEERKLVGATKAFGFTNREILYKYMIFAVSASVVGVLLGIVMAIIIASAIQNLFTETNMYIFDVRRLYIDWPATLIIAVLEIGMCSLVTVSACSGLLSNSAYYLMNGLSNPKKKQKKKKASARRTSGSLYSRLILRNMINEKARVLISIIIIAGSCTIVGVGISLKTGFDGMSKKQMSDVIHYDYSVHYDSRVTEEELETLKTRLEEAGTSSLPVLNGPVLFDDQGALQGLFLLCADDDQLSDFYAVHDLHTGKILDLPDHGILIQRRLNESFGISPGETMTILDATLNHYEADVAGEFENYQGRTAVCSPESYREIFGKEPAFNTFLVRLNGMDETKFLSLVTSVSPHVTVERSDAFLNALQGTFILYNVIVGISIGIAVIMSFIILTNLSNIYLNRKKKELTVMRINGFTTQETLNYLSRETIITVLIGLVAGVLFGIVLSYFMIRLVEPRDAQFVRSASPLTWIIAFLLEGTFAFLINWNVFRKVKTLNFRDIM